MHKLPQVFSFALICIIHIYVQKYAKYVSMKGTCKIC